MIFAAITFLIDAATESSHTARGAEDSKKFLRSYDECLNILPET